MGGVLSAATVGEAAVEFVRAGGDLCLICHREDYILQAHEELVKTAERDSKFARRVAEAARRVAAFKKKSAKTLRRVTVPSIATVEKLTRRLWEFGEQVRLEPFSRRADKRRPRS
jgi:beta-glucosidase-like glycosyl hydrolase